MVDDLYHEKIAWFFDSKVAKTLKFKAAAAADFYRDIFPRGSFQRVQGRDYLKDGRGNGFLVYKTADDKMHTRMVFDDHFEIWEHIRDNTVFMSPIAYFGRNRSAVNARELYALVFDLDEVSAEALNLFFEYYCIHKKFPFPTYVVVSGNGLHLYYVFKKSVPLYPKIQQELKRLKYALTDLMWNEDTSGFKQKQYQGINQGFRIVGSGTKQGNTVFAFKTGDKVSLAYLSSFVEPENRILDTFYHSKMTLDEAKKKYPEWYHQRIELGRKKKSWTCKRDLYDWWLRQSYKATIHHRYFYLMALSCYAIKCEIDYGELKQDAYRLMPKLDTDSTHPFTKHDVESALEMYQECYRSFPRNDIEKLSGILIPKNKRNGRKQDIHLKRARAVQMIDYPDNEWAGRKSYKEAVFKFLDMNPKASYKEFVELTGMQKSVFYKYKKQWLSVVCLRVV